MCRPSDTNESPRRRWFARSGGVAVVGFILQKRRIWRTSTNVCPEDVPFLGPANEIIHEALPRLLEVVARQGCRSQAAQASASRSGWELFALGRRPSSIGAGKIDPGAVMGRRQQRILAGVVAGAAVLAACGASILTADGGGSVGENEWSLEGVSLDGQHLVVSTLFGGVASGCSRFEGWEVNESEDSVEISVRLWRLSAPSDCTDEGVVELLQVDLDRPLDDRELVGCGVDDCRGTVVDGGNLFVGHVVASGDAVAVADESGLDAYGPSGELLTEDAGAIPGEMLAIGDGMVVGNDRNGAAIAIDLLAGEEIWRTTGWIAAANVGVVYVCRGQDSDGLTAVDAATGADRWETALPCESLVVHDDLLTIVGHDPNVDGGHRVTVVDAASGELVAESELFDGIDDRVTGLDGAIAVGLKTITSGPQANLIVLGSDGTELAREADGLGVPLGEAGGVVILGSYDRLAGYDIAEASELWTQNIDAFSSVSVDNGSVWRLDRADGVVSRLDARTGGVLWSTSIGATTSFDATGDGDTAYILTTQAVIAVDNATGSLRWSAHRPYEAAN